MDVESHYFLFPTKLESIILERFFERLCFTFTLVKNATFQLKRSTKLYNVVGFFLRPQPDSIDLI